MNFLRFAAYARLFFAVASFFVLLSACSVAHSEPRIVDVPNATLSPVNTTSTASIPNEKQAKLRQPILGQPILGQPVPEPSQTPRRPAPTNSPTSLPTLLPIPASSISNIVQTSDLLYLSKGNLMRWDHFTDFTGMLVEGVVYFSANASGKQIALLRPKKVAANGVELYDLDLLDLERMQVVTLLEQTSRLGNVTISPNGRWVVYTLGEHVITVYALPVDKATQATELGTCVNESKMQCEQFIWSPDSQLIAWNDIRGIWISPLKGIVDSPAHTRIVEVKDPEGEKTEIEVDFHSLKWSPAGRFLLAKIAPSASDVKWLAVLDTLTGRLAAVPDTYEHKTPNANALWMSDGKLLLIHTSDRTGQSYLYVKLWQIIPTSIDLLVPQDISEQVSGDFGIPLHLNPTVLTFCPAWLAQLEENSILLEIAPPQGVTATLLFSLDLKEQTLQKLLDIPFDIDEMLWSPDGYGALILGGHSQIIFAPIDGSSSYNLRPILGDDAHGFHWLAPSPRS